MQKPHNFLKISIFLTKNNASNNSYLICIASQQFSKTMPLELIFKKLFQSQMNQASLMWIACWYVYWLLEMEGGAGVIAMKKHMYTTLKT